MSPARGVAEKANCPIPGGWLQVPPRWVADLGHCLDWKTIIPYRFKHANHININEELSYRSLVQHVAKVAQAVGSVLSSTAG